MKRQAEWPANGDPSSNVYYQQSEPSSTGQNSSGYTIMDTNSLATMYSSSYSSPEYMAALATAYQQQGATGVPFIDSRKICRFFQTGSCRYGLNCLYRHEFFPFASSAPCKFHFSFCIFFWLKMIFFSSDFLIRRKAVKMETLVFLCISGQIRNHELNMSPPLRNNISIQLNIQANSRTLLPWHSHQPKRVLQSHICQKKLRHLLSLNRTKRTRRKDPNRGVVVRRKAKSNERMEEVVTKGIQVVPLLPHVKKTKRKPKKNNLSFCLTSPFHKDFCVFFIMFFVKKIGRNKLNQKKRE